MDYSTPCQYSIRLMDKLKSLDTQNLLDFNLIEKAICFAKKYHDGQFRKSGEPFYTHPLEVAYMISDYNLKTDVIVASILHDVVEDTEATAGMVLDHFSWRIAEMVDRLTRDRPDGTKLTVEEIINNAYKLKDHDVLMIKLIDRLHNVQTLDAMKPDKIKKTITQTLKKFMTLGMYLGETMNNPLEIERIFFKSCHQYVSTEPASTKGITAIFSNTYLLPSLTSQNKISQIHNLLP